MQAGGGYFGCNKRADNAETAQNRICACLPLRLFTLLTGGAAGSARFLSSRAVFPTGPGSVSCFSVLVWAVPRRAEGGGRREPETTRGTATPAPAQICAEQKHICYCSRCPPQRHVPYFIFHICAWANPCEHARSLLFTHAVFSKLLQISKPDTKQTPILPSTGSYAESPLFSQWVQ